MNSIAIVDYSQLVNRFDLFIFLVMMAICIFFLLIIYETELF